MKKMLQKKVRRKIQRKLSEKYLIIENEVSEALREKKTG